MNKIYIKDNQITTEINDDINITYENILDILKINIHINQNTTLELLDIGLESKLDIKIYIEKDKTLNLIEGRRVLKSKIQNKYFLKENSTLNIERLYQVNEAKQMDLIFLNEPKATAKIEFTNIALDKGKYSLISYHNASLTNFYIKNRGVSLKKGSLEYRITGIVYNNMKKCIIDQNNRILSLNDNKNLIKPILLIEEEDVVANHSAYIGSVSDEELFYFLSRGISKEQATNLILQGYINTTNESLQKIIEWEVIK